LAHGLFEQCQTADKVASVLDKLKEKKQPNEKNTAHFLIACSCDLNHQHHHCKNPAAIKVTDMIATNTNTIVTIKTIDATITFAPKRRTKTKNLQEER
jgi:hypothetical protein